MIMGYRAHMHVSTAAQEFLKHPYKVWWHDVDPHLCTGVPSSPKFLLWARAMLISEYERNRLDQAGILKGVLACIYRVNLSWPLIQAFISFWNSDGHTLVTAQGEMGYPLMVIQEAMGIPISGRRMMNMFERTNVNDKVAKELFAAYAVLSWHNC